MKCFTIRWVRKIILTVTGCELDSTPFLCRCGNKLLYTEVSGTVVISWESLQATWLVGGTGGEV